MWSFEGEYKSRPKQSLSGRSKAVDKATLLLQLRSERENREIEKKRLKSATIIQTWMRGYWVRKQFNELLRQNFDSDISSLKTTTNPSKVMSDSIANLLKFFNPDKDSARLIGICQLLVQGNQDVKEWTAGETQKWNILLSKLLSLSLKMLNHKGHPSVPIHPVILRLMEILISPSFLPEASKEQFLLNMFQHLLSSGYYGDLVRFLKEKVPDLYEPTLKPPTPLAEFILRLFLFPLDMLNVVSADVSFIDTWLEQLWNEVLGNSQCSQIRYFVLPNFAQSPSMKHKIKERLLYFSQIFIQSPGFQADTWTLFGVLQIVNPNHDFQLAESFHCLLCIINFYFENAPLYIHGSVYDVDQEMDEFFVDFIPELATPEQAEPQRLCLETLESTKYVAWIVRNLTHYVNTPEIVLAFSRLFHSLIIRQKYKLHQCRMLYCFVLNKSVLLRPMWMTLNNVGVNGKMEILKGRTLVQAIVNGCYFDQSEIDVLHPVLTVFCAALSAVLSTLHDSEFSAGNESGTSFPFSNREIQDISTILRDVCVGITELVCQNSRMSSYCTPEKRFIWRNCFKMCARVLRHLHLRDTRLSLYAEDHWIAKKTIVNQKVLDGLLHSEDLEFNELLHSEHLENNGSRSYTLSGPEQRFFALMQEVPFVFSFELRMNIFRHAMHAEREVHQDSFLHRPVIDLSVRRSHLYEDSFDKLDTRNEPTLKKRFRVKLTNTAGATEAGVDGGGLFREFSSELLKSAFDPNRGFFLLTRDNMLYPNPSSPLLHSDFEKHYFFIGRMLGKIIFEHHLVELPLAGFFLTKLLSENNSVEFHYLDSLDPDLCRNLLSLKNYDDNIQDLGLDFTVTTSELGKTSIVDLIPNGSNIQVTKENCIEYIYRMADYKLNKQIARQCKAFKEGLNEMVGPKLLKLFSWKEVQMLISGAIGSIDVQDLRANTKYAGEYTAEHPNIIRFWNVVEAFDETQRRQLIKFVTSCSRPPLSGFKELSPPFSINPSGCQDRLPSASTCMNLLKLPCYNDERLLREKLLYAICSGAGFELS